MADKAISELIAASQVTPTDLFVLEQSGTAKKLTGQTLENWLLSFAEGHGGIQSIVKQGTSGLKDTYRITLSDTTTIDFVVTNGRGITSVTKIGTSGLVDTYAFKYNDGTSTNFTVTNGAKGDKGDNTYTHIKYASREPTATSHSFGDVPDKWIGFYWGNSSTAPTDWTQYKWYQFKGDKGDTGSPATLTSAVVEYQVGNSGTIIPSEAWSVAIPTVPQSKYLWTRTTQKFNTGSPVVSYSVSRMGLDGKGSVRTVNNVSPNAEGNVVLTYADVGARANTWIPTAEEVGAAPSGYGLGTNGELRDVSTFDELDGIRLNGRYFIRFQAPFYIDGHLAQYFCLDVESETYQHVHQKITVIGTNYILHRYCDNGAWGVLEWDNPPMAMGVEYRTTERYNEKVVYAKHYNAGKFVNNGYFALPDGAVDVVRYFGYFGEAKRLLPIGRYADPSSNYYAYLSKEVSASKVIYTYQNGFTDGANDLLVTVYYTKD